MNDFAPVAEYRGVAILERTGTVRAVWNGSEYRTDGKVYVWFQTEEPAQVGMIEFPTERDVKEVLDVALVGERLLNADTGNRYRLLSRGECIAILCRGNPAMMALALCKSLAGPGTKEPGSSSTKANDRPGLKMARIDTANNNRHRPPS